MEASWWIYGCHSENDPYFGYCSSPEEAVSVLQAFEEATSTNFVVLKKERNFGDMDISARNHFVMFEGKMAKDDKSTIPFCGVPFLVLSQRVYECQHGIDRHLTQKQQNEKEPSKKPRNLAQTLLKLDCPAKVIMKEVVLFPEFMVKENIDSRKKKISKQLRDALKGKDELQAEQRIYISFPMHDKHRNHKTAEIGGVRKRQRMMDSVSQILKQGEVTEPPMPIWPTYEELEEQAAIERDKDLDTANLRVFTTEEEVWEYIEQFQINTSTKYVIHTKDKSFGNKNWKPDSIHRIYWRHPVSLSPVSIDFDGFPFMFVGRKILCCHRGPDQGISKKRKRAEIRKQLDQAPMRNVTSKKLGCKAQIYISHIVKFPGYEINKDTEKRRKTAASKLRSAIKDSSVPFKTFFLVSTPSSSDHEGHLLDAAELETGKKRKTETPVSLSNITAVNDKANNEVEIIVGKSKPADIVEDDPETRRMELMFQCDVKLDAIRELMNNLNDETCLADLQENLEKVFTRALMYPISSRNDKRVYIENVEWTENNDVMAMPEDDEVAAESFEDRMCEVHIDMDS